MNPDPTPAPDLDEEERRLLEELPQAYQSLESDDNRQWLERIIRRTEEMLRSAPVEEDDP